MKLYSINISLDTSTNNYDKTTNSFRENYVGSASFKGKNGSITVDLTNEDILNIQQMLLKKARDVVECQDA